jgi:hypothetical protein
VIGRHTIWNHPLEIAAQLIYDLLLTCSDVDPWKTSFLVVFPSWVLEKHWGCTS